jgi:chromosome segregation ATPase
MQSQQSAQQLMDAEHKIEQAQEALQSMTEDRDELRDRLFKNAVPELASCNKRIEELVRETKLQRKTLSSTALQLANLTEEYGQVQDDLSMTAQQLADTRHELEQVNERVEGLHRESQLQKKTISSHVQNIAALEAEKASMQKEGEKMRAATEAAERELQLMRERQQPLIAYVN